MANLPDDSPLVDAATAGGPSGVAPSAPIARPIGKPVNKPVGKPVPSANLGPAASPTEPPAADAAIPARSDYQWVIKDIPGWLASLALHFAILLTFALWSLPVLPDLTTELLLVEPAVDEIGDVEEIPELLLDPAIEQEPVELEIQPETEIIADVASFSTFDEATSAPSFTALSELALTTAPPSVPTDLQGFDGKGTSGRGRRARTSLVRRHGGSQASEQAVADALNWLADHQNPDGTWSLVHDRHECRGRCPDPSLLANQPGGYAASLRSGTGLALLPFLGAGQTADKGRHRKTVERGLRALIALGAIEEKRPGASWRDSGNMYAHGIAAIVLTEAYGMTRDPALRGPAQAAVDYIAYAQDPKSGGWRYRPRERGDTSVTGWQIMALKSAYLADIAVPKPVVTNATKFLDAVQDASGARYSYVIEQDNGAKPRPRKAMDAVGLLCRMYLGWDRERPELVAGVKNLAKLGPAEKDYYYNYYATQVLFQHTGGLGPVWRKWNRQMRDQLIAQQIKTGHAKGSWYQDGPHNDRGGRIYMTSLATMSLEVYYRYLPIYGAEAVSNEFPQ